MRGRAGIGGGGSLGSPAALGFIFGHRKLVPVGIIPSGQTTRLVGGSVSQGRIRLTKLTSRNRRYKEENDTGKRRHVGMFNEDDGRGL